MLKFCKMRNRRIRERRGGVPLSVNLRWKEISFPGKPSRILQCPPVLRSRDEWPCIVISRGQKAGRLFRRDRIRPTQPSCYCGPNAPQRLRAGKSHLRPKVFEVAVEKQNPAQHLAAVAWADAVSSY